MKLGASIRRLLATSSYRMFVIGSIAGISLYSATQASGLATVGVGSTLNDSLEPHVATVDDVAVAFLGASTNLPNGSAAGAFRSGVAPVRVRNSYALDPVTLEEVPGMAPFVHTEAVEEDVERLCTAVRGAAEQANIVILNIHWGVPLGWAAAHQHEIAEYQRPLAGAIIDAGASVIIGHGPHVIQEVEYYRGAPIFYSVGNFVFHDVLPQAGTSPGAFPTYRWESLNTEWNAIGGIARLK